MHKIFVTEGIVLGKRAVGEASALAIILTAELGLVAARAQSARAEKSKLRYVLEPFSLGRFSLLRGKHEWRLTGAERGSRELLEGTPGTRRRLGRVARLLLRLVLGQEPGQALYTSVLNGFGFIAAAESEVEAESAECVLVLRILASLGYLPQHPELAAFIEAPLFSLELAAKAKESRATIIKAINTSLDATGL